jgi:iron(III) transport system substrate-binding protein
MKHLFPILLVMSLAACGQQDEPEAPAPTLPEVVETDAAVEPRTVVVYSSRQPHLIEPLFERFTEATGIAVEFSNDNEAALIERLAAEGDNTPADVFMTVDAGNLWQASERGLLRPINSEALNAAVPASLRGADNEWFGLSLRARSMVYHPDRVDPAELSTYEDLADPRWEGRLCLRTSRKVYNQSLVAMLIEHHGVERTEEIVSGWVSNLATNPFSSDTLLIEAVEAGQCDVGIVNTYYLGRKMADDENYPVTLAWANQDTTGVHVNVSGAGVTTHAPNPDLGQTLIEWLASDAAQAEFAERNLEFPVNPGVPAEGLVRKWGSFVQDETPLAIAGQRQAEAVRLMDRVGYR